MKRLCFRKECNDHLPVLTVMVGSQLSQPSIQIKWGKVTGPSNFNLQAMSHARVKPTLEVIPSSQAKILNNTIVLTVKNLSETIDTLSSMPRIMS